MRQAIGSAFRAAAELTRRDKNDMSKEGNAYARRMSKVMPDAANGAAPNGDAAQAETPTKRNAVQAGKDASEVMGTFEMVYLGSSPVKHKNGRTVAVAAVEALAVHAHVHPLSSHMHNRFGASVTDIRMTLRGRWWMNAGDPAKGKFAKGCCHRIRRRDQGYRHYHIGAGACVEFAISRVSRQAKLPNILSRCVHVLTLAHGDSLPLVLGSAYFAITSSEEGPLVKKVGKKVKNTGGLVALFVNDDRLKRTTVAAFSCRSPAVGRDVCVALKKAFQVGRYPTQHMWCASCAVCAPWFSLAMGVVVWWCAGARRDQET